MGVASVDEKIAIEGKVVKKQIGLNSFATFSEPLSAPALLLNSCCTLEGIVTSEGIIEKEYVERFLKMLAEYKKGEDITRERLYLETMEHVLKNANKTIVDAKSLNINVINISGSSPLEDLLRKGGK